MADAVADALDRILEAHGGPAYWESLSANTREPHVVMWDYPAPGQQAVLEGCGQVRILDDSGTVPLSATGTTHCDGTPWISPTSAGTRGGTI